MTSDPDGRFLISGSLCLDTAAQELFVDGVPVKLGAKALALLGRLMAESGELVTKDQLFDAAWPGLAVSESVLTTAIKEVRQAIGDDARNPTVIQTMHGRGYRFLLPVVRSNTRSANAPPVEVATTSGRRWLYPALGLALAAILGVAAFLLLESRPGPVAPVDAPADPKSIAVLPFDDLSPGKEQDWFAAGLTEELLTTLARTPDLKVASRTASERYGSPGTDITAAAAVLGVANILEGSVRHDGDRVRVSVQLIRAADGFQLWSANLDRSAADVIDIQEEVAFEIARALKTVLDPGQLRAMVAAGTRSVDAYRAFLRAQAFDLEHFRTGSVDMARRAYDAYEEARSIDPDFARAHWEAAGRWFGYETRIGADGGHVAIDDATRIRNHVERVEAAIAVAPNEADRLKYSAAVALANLRIDEAKRLLESALDLRPRDIDGWTQLIDIAAYAGDRTLSAKAAERVYTLSLESGEPLSRAITASVMSGEYATAAKRARHFLKLRPDNMVMRYQVHRALLAAGEIEEARELLPTLRTGDLPRSNRLLADLRQACAEGDVDRAGEIYARIRTLPTINSNAMWLAAMTFGREDHAFQALRPLDTPERLPRLVQSMIYPNFDARRYPELMKALSRQGITPHEPRPFPSDCKQSDG